MHYILAFAVHSNRSLDDRLKELDALYLGETNKYDGLKIVAFRHLQEAWEHPPYAYVDGSNQWREADDDGYESSWRHEWMKAALDMATDYLTVIVYADCHR